MYAMDKPLPDDYSAELRGDDMQLVAGRENSCYLATARGDLDVGEIKGKSGWPPLPVLSD